MMEWPKKVNLMTKSTKLEMTQEAQIYLATYESDKADNHEKTWKKNK